MFHLTEGVDSGDVIAQKAFPLGPLDSCADAYDKATVAALEMLEENWQAFRQGRPARLPQDESKATFNVRRRPQDGAIDWSKSAVDLHNWVRALARPYPGAFCKFREKTLFVWKARAVKGGKPARVKASASLGEVVQAQGRLIVATGGGGLLELVSLQFQGEPECPAPVFVATYSIKTGELLS